jgi:hypothetical protein
MRATFIGGPCGGHSHSMGDADAPEIRTHGCPSSSAKDDAKGSYVRVGSPSRVAGVGAPETRGVTFYKWLAEVEDGGRSEAARPRG